MTLISQATAQTKDSIHRNLSHIDHATAAPDVSTGAAFFIYEESQMPKANAVGKREENLAFTYGFAPKTPRFRPARTLVFRAVHLIESLQ